MKNIKNEIWNLVSIKLKGDIMFDLIKRNKDSVNNWYFVWNKSTGLIKSSIDRKIYDLIFRIN